MQDLSQIGPKILAHVKLLQHDFALPINAIFLRLSCWLLSEKLHLRAETGSHDWLHYTLQVLHALQDAHLPTQLELDTLQGFDHSWQPSHLRDAFLQQTPAKQDLQRMLFYTQ